MASTDRAIDKAHSVEVEKLQNENEKLRLEIEDLKRWRIKTVLGIVSIMLSPLVTVLGGLAGYYISQSSQRIQSADALYAQVVTEFGSTSAGTRLGAISSMKRFIAPRPKPSVLVGLLRRITGIHRESVAEDQRIRNCMYLLVSRLAEETDVEVSKAIINAVVTNPEYALPVLAEANRRAAAAFSRAAGQYSGLWLLRMTGANSVDTDAVPPAFKQATQELIFDEIYRSVDLFDSSLEENATFFTRPFLSSPPFSNIFLKQERSASRADLPAAARQHLSPLSGDAIDNARADLLQQARYIEATSKALTSILSENSPLGADKNLQAVALVCGRYSDVLDFSQFDLRSAYVSGRTNKVIFNKALLVGTSLTNFRFDEADFSEARVSGMRLCADWMTYGRALPQADLKGVLLLRNCN